ncbi:CPBP family intramembrane glutamic endopeptidase [Pyxidicoccus sp. 3LG]
MAAFIQTVDALGADAGRELSWRERGWLLVVAAAAYATTLWPTPVLRVWVRDLAGRPGYAGAWLVLEHLLLYTTLCAAVCLGVWAGFSRWGWLPAPRSWLGFGERKWFTLAWGVGAGLAAVLLYVCLRLLAHRLGLLPGQWEPSLHPPEGWKVLGNVFSNFYEELIYRGFLLVVARAVLRSTPLAIVVTSLVFGLTHVQQLPMFRVLIVGAGMVMALACVRTRSIWAAWLCHQVYDVLLSMMVG